MALATAAPLYLRELSVYALRCHSASRWQFSEGVNLLTGDNGCGKTTLLESAHLMVYGRSFRQARDPDLVQRGKGMFRINGIWVRYGPLHLDVQGKRGSTQISFQGRKVGRRKELTESMPVLAEAPQGGKLVDGVPNERRRWLDELMLACEPGLHHAYQAYLRAMVQRSRLLRSHYGAAQLDAWEYQIVLHGLKLIQARASLLTGLNTLLADEQGLTEQGLSLQLASSVPVEEQAWLQALVAGRDQDRRMGRMLIGPHTDRVKV